MKNYTIGEIYREKLLKNSLGQPYASKGSISNVLKSYPYEEKMTAHGPAKMYSQETIDLVNKKWG